MRTESVVVPTGDPRAAASLARRASLLVTSRYHPAVFAAPAGVPILALTADAYTTVKLTGALGGWGQTQVHDLDLAASDGLGPALRRAAYTATAARLAADQALPAARTAAALWWDRVADAASTA
jgi:hypothetical protein